MDALSSEAVAIASVSPAAARPGTPSLLRELNDRAALDLLLAGEPLTRAQISERTGVSKVTVREVLARLEERGLVTVAGEQAGGRGPNAALYAVVPSSAYVAGLYVESDLVSAAVADVTGRCVAEVSVDPNGADDPVQLVRGAVDRACTSAGVDLSRLTALVIGSPGVLDPRTGDPRLAVNLPAWHEEAIAGRAARGAAPAGDHRERREPGRDGGTLGRSRGRSGRLRAGLAGWRPRPGHRPRRPECAAAWQGAAGEIGWLPVHGAPLPTNAHPAGVGFQFLAGGKAVRELAAQHGYIGYASTGDAVRAAVVELVRRSPTNWRTGWQSVWPPCAWCSSRGWSCSAGRSGRPAGRHWPAASPRRWRGSAWPSPRVVPTAVPGEPVLRGALLAALAQARAALLASVGDPAA